MESLHNRNIFRKSLQIFYLINCFAGFAGLITGRFENTFVVVIQMMTLLVSVILYISLKIGKFPPWLKTTSFLFFFILIIIGMWLNLGSANPIFIVYTLFFSQALVISYEKKKALIYSSLFAFSVVTFSIIDIVVRADSADVMKFTIGRFFGVGIILSGVLVIIIYNKILTENLIHDLKIHSYTDSLTGAKNNRAFYEMLEVNENVYKRYDRDYILAYVDLDNFKTINDAFGHEKGDEILKSFVEFLLENLRLSDSVFRIGGDEFIVLFTGVDTLAVSQAMSKLKELLKDHREDLLDLQFSYGIASRHQLQKGGRDLINFADNEMYIMKNKTNVKI